MEFLQLKEHLTKYLTEVPTVVPVDVPAVKVDAVQEPKVEEAPP